MLPGRMHQVDAGVSSGAGRQCLYLIEDGFIEVSTSFLDAVYLSRYPNGSLRANS